MPRSKLQAPRYTAGTSDDCATRSVIFATVEEGVVAVVATVKSIPGGCLIGPLELQLFISQSGKLLCLQMIFS